MTVTDYAPQDFQKIFDANQESEKNTTYVQSTHYMGKDSIGTDYNYKHEWVWKNVIVLLILHTCAAYGLFLMCIGECQFYTVMWVFAVAIISSEGVTIGAHRHYSHKAFKAKPILQAIFILLQTVSGQNSMFIWCRDHRLHHRYSDTDGDPHNSKRGFFFCHMGWLMTKKHPLVIELGKKIDLSDLKADWMVMFQKKYYYILYVICAVMFPVLVPIYYFEESWKNAIFATYFFRYMLHLNLTWLVNSAAHLYGTRPYDAKMQPVDSWFISFISLGEGWHNYHHTFPWDYKAAELTMHFNFSADVIRFFEIIGLAWDLKSASPKMVKDRIIRTGDGTHYEYGTASKPDVTAVGFVHPINPSYTTVLKDPTPVLSLRGLPLYHEKDVLDVDY